MTDPKDWTDVLLYFVPAVLVILTFFIVIKRFLETQQSMLRRFLERDFAVKKIEEQAVRQKESMPLRLQAYERLILFLERISANSMLVRIHRGGMSATQLHSDLIATIRAEFEHNLSQQLYVSDNAWAEVCMAKEEMVRIINRAYSETGANSSGIQLSSEIFEEVLKLDAIPTQKAIDFLKTEARKLLA